MPEQRRPWKRRAAYVAFALVSFVFALRQTFPVDAVADRLVLEAAAAGWQLRMADVAPAGLVGVRMDAVTLESADGARIPLDRLTATLRLLPLVLGRRAVDFDARIWDGRVTGTAEQGRSSRHLAARVDGVNLARAAAMRKLAHVDLTGTASGDVDLGLDERDATKSTGRVDLAVSQAAIVGGEVPIAAMGGSALTLPRVGLGTVTAKGTVRGGRLSFDTLGAKGGDDVELEGGGLSVTLQPRLAQAPLFGHAKVRFKDAFWQKPATNSLRGIVELALAPGKAPDGSYGFQLFGTLGNPQARPGAAPAVPPPRTAAPPARGAPGTDAAE